MNTTYAQRQTTAQKKDAPSAFSVIDASSQSESLQRKADMANSTAQRVETPRPNNTGMPVQKMANPTGAFARIKQFGMNWKVLDREKYISELRNGAGDPIVETSHGFNEGKYIQLLSDGSIIVTDTTGQYWRHEDASQVDCYFDETHHINGDNAQTHFWMSSDLKTEKMQTAQLKSSTNNTTNSNLQNLRPNNTGMPDNLKAGIESLSGFSMDDVRVHYNSSKPATVQALAYTQGTDIHVAPGQEKCLPHEAWHVAQQMAGCVSPTTNINGMPVNDNAALEHEADVMGEKAVYQLKPEHPMPRDEGRSSLMAGSTSISSGYKRHHVIPIGKINAVIRNICSRWEDAEDDDLYECRQQIVKFLKYAIDSYFSGPKSDGEVSKDQLTEFVENVWMEKLSDYSDKEHFFQTLYACVDWVPGNLFIGPEKRSDDPKNSFETYSKSIIGDEKYELLKNIMLNDELLSESTKSTDISTYINAIATSLATLSSDEYGKLTQYDPEMWERDSEFYRIKGAPIPRSAMERQYMNYLSVIGKKQKKIDKFKGNVSKPNEDNEVNKLISELEQLLDNIRVDVQEIKDRDVGSYGEYPQQSTEQYRRRILLIENNLGEFERKKDAIEAFFHPQKESEKPQEKEDDENDDGDFDLSFLG